MQEELETLKPELKKAAEINNEMVKVIENESAAIEEKGEKVKVEEEIANEQVQKFYLSFNKYKQNTLSFFLFKFKWFESI